MTERSKPKNINIQINEILDSIGEEFYAVDKDGTIIYVNSYVEKRLKISREMLIGRNIRDYMPEDRAKEFYHNFRKVCRDKKPRIMSGYFHSDNKWTNVFMFPLGDGVSILNADMTKQKRVEEELRVSRERLNRILDTIADGIIIYDKDFHLVFTNLEARKIFGFHKSTKDDDIIQFPESRVFDLNGEHLPKEKLPYYQVMKSQKMVKGVEYAIDRGKDDRLVVSVNSSPLFNSRGEIEGVVSSVRDVTKEKEDQRNRDYFTGIVSHELKNPLASIKLISQMAKGELSKKRMVTLANNMGRIDEKVNEMSRIINGLLESSRLQVGKLELHKEEFDFDEMAREAVEDAAGVTKNHKLRIVGLTRTKVIADKERLHQVITNLLSNAIKYSDDKKSVLIRLCKLGDKVSISVQDRGIGIKRSERKRIFNMYYQAKDKRVAEGSGMGIGLFLVKGIVLAHKGKIKVRSRVNKGSTFEVTIPVGRKDE